MSIKELFQEKLKKTLFLAFLIAVINIIFVSDFFFFCYEPATSEIQKKDVIIKRGMSLREISDILRKNQVISDPILFRCLVCWERMDKKLEAGDYHFTTFLSPVSVILKLQKGEEKLYKITIPEGYTVEQIAHRIDIRKLAKYQDVIKMAKNKDFIRSLGLNVSSLEGYLFPNTYFLPKTQNPSGLLTVMVREFEEHFQKIWEERSSDNTLNPRQVVILASMVEKEALLNKEKPIIAGVFYNRLKKGMLLQCDPTVIYGLENFNGDLTKKDLLRDSPYNTYLHKGLPPGPICNPGLSSLMAALHPAKIPFIYFVSENNGHHFFSVTFAQHLKAVRRFQIRQKGNGKRLK